MSQKSVSQIIGRALSDRTFRRLLEIDPNRALAGFDLTQDEVNLIHSSLQAGAPPAASELEPRISRARLPLDVLSGLMDAITTDARGLGVSGPSLPAEDTAAASPVGRQAELAEAARPEVEARGSDAGPMLPARNGSLDGVAIEGEAAGGGIGALPGSEVPERHEWMGGAGSTPSGLSGQGSGLGGISSGGGPAGMGGSGTGASSSSGMGGLEHGMREEPWQGEPAGGMDGGAKSNFDSDAEAAAIIAQVEAESGAAIAQAQAGVSTPVEN